MVKFKINENKLRQLVSESVKNVLIDYHSSKTNVVESMCEDASNEVDLFDVKIWKELQETLKKNGIEAYLSDEGRGIFKVSVDSDATTEARRVAEGFATRYGLIASADVYPARTIIRLRPDYFR